MTDVHREVKSGAVKQSQQQVDRFPPKRVAYLEPHQLKALVVDLVHQQTNDDAREVALQTDRIEKKNFVAQVKLGNCIRTVLVSEFYEPYLSLGPRRSRF